VNRRLGALAWIGFASLFGGCGGSVNSSVLNETGVRECLANAGIRQQFSGAAQGGWKGYAPIYAADFTAQTTDGVSIDLVIQRSASRARATAADVRSSLRSFAPSTANAADRVISAENAVAVFSRPGSAADRNAVRHCLAG
jgi:hypothetical protein